jgi:hypothetical protein
MADKIVRPPSIKIAKFQGLKDFSVGFFTWRSSLTSLLLGNLQEPLPVRGRGAERQLVRTIQRPLS